MKRAFIEGFTEQILKRAEESGPVPLYSPQVKFRGQQVPLTRFAPKYTPPKAPYNMRPEWETLGTEGFKVRRMGRPQNLSEGVRSGIEDEMLRFFPEIYSPYHADRAGGPLQEYVSPKDISPQTTAVGGADIRHIMQLHARNTMARRNSQNNPDLRLGSREYIIPHVMPGAGHVIDYNQSLFGAPSLSPEKLKGIIETSDPGLRKIYQQITGKDIPVWANSLSQQDAALRNAVTNYQYGEPPVGKALLPKAEQALTELFNSALVKDIAQQYAAGVAKEQARIRANPPPGMLESIGQGIQGLGQYYPAFAADKLAPVREFLEQYGPLPRGTGGSAGGVR